MNTKWRTMRAVAAVAAVAVVFAACGSSKSNGSKATTPATNLKKGGTIVIGAEQWPDCLNMVTQCANSSWAYWDSSIHTFPRLMEVTATGEFANSPLLASDPVVQDSPFQVTYKLNPKAVWNDGTPITSADIAFTWHAKIDTKGSLSTVGYDVITAVDTPDPQTAVVKFKQPFVDWADLFGGATDFVLKKAAFKSTDVSKDMQRMFTFSGGPWVLQSFSKTQAVFVPNKKYWDPSRIPLADKMVLVPRTDTDTELQSLKSGEVFAIYPQPAAGTTEQLVDPNIKTATGVTTQYESFWFNESKPPFNDKKVREAFFYATDRQKFLDTIVKPFSPKVQPLNCADWVPSVGKWCDQTQFADLLTANKAKVDSTMTADGYTKDGAGYWSKGGQELTIKWTVNTGNKRREDTQSLMIPMYKDMGFKVVADNSDADTYFQKRLPSLDYEMAMYISVVSPDPSITAFMACDNIPSKTHPNGQNTAAWCNKDATALMHKSDQELDPAARLDEIHQIGKFIRDDFVTLPLYQFPTLVAWRSDKLAGPVDALVSAIYSPLGNAYAWSVK